VTIGLFEASETTMPTMVPKLWAFFDKFSFTKKKILKPNKTFFFKLIKQYKNIRYVKNEGSNL